MTWVRLPLCFELVTPLHVGFLPNRPGTVVAQTRCYVPGKNLWGAVTATITPWLYPTSTAGNFRDVGASIMEQMVFSYFYLSDGEQVFTPDYAKNGLQWGKLEDRTFRSQFIGSQVSTAIGEAGGAEQTSLHEIEFVRHYVGWPGKVTQKVLLMGAVWVRNGANIVQSALAVRDGSVFLNEFDVFQEIVLGGERNYGFGRLRRIPVRGQCKAILMNLWPDDPEDELTIDEEQCVPAHVPYRKDLIFKGEIEIVAGREYPRNSDNIGFHGSGKKITNAGYFFAPGTRLNGIGVAMRIDSMGRYAWTSSMSTRG